MTVVIQAHRPCHLEQLQRLVNCHLASVVPGWRLPSGVIATSLELAPDGTPVDPWVADRRTLCAVTGDRLLGAAHVLRYSAAPEVAAGYRASVELAWLLFWPEAEVAAHGLLAAVAELAVRWRAQRVHACDTSLPVPVVSGVPESWPHVSAALVRSGFSPHPSVEEVLYGGRLPDVGTSPPPIDGLQLRAAAGEPGSRFRAELDGEAIGFLEWSPDLSFGGTLPALSGWAELCTLQVREEWRGRGVGSWLVRRTIPFLRMVGVSRVVVALTAQEESGGAGELCRRVGWEPVVRLEQGWTSGAGAG